MDTAEVQASETLERTTENFLKETAGNGQLSETLLQSLKSVGITIDELFELDLKTTNANADAEKLGEMKSNGIARSALKDMFIKTRKAEARAFQMQANEIREERSKHGINLPKLTIPAPTKDILFQ